MKKKRRLWNRWTACCLLCSMAGVPADAGAQIPELLAGAAQVNITPPAGYPHYRGISTGVHDTLYAKALVLSEGERKLALVVCDLLWIERDLSARVRVKAAEETGIPFSNIILSATHSHTSPAYHRNILELNEHLRETPAPEMEPDDVRDSPDWLVEGIRQAIADAYKALEPVYLEQGAGETTELSFNRRYVMKDGKVRTNPGVMNPDIVRAAGPIDPEVGIAVLRSKENKQPLACLTSFATHGDTFGGTEFSADYPGFLAKALETILAEDPISLYLQGASGDLNHVDVSSDSQLSTREIGEKLAAVVEAGLSELERVEHPFLGTRAEIVYAPLQHYTAEELAWAKDKTAEPLYGESGLFARRRPMKIRSLERIRQTEAIPPAIGTEPWTLPLEVQVFGIGEDLAIVGLPGEVFVELGLAIKKASPFKTTFVIELTNSHIAYVPTRKAFAQGGYETLNSRLAPGGGELMVQAAVKMLEELYAEIE